MKSQGKRASKRREESMVYSNTIIIISTALYRKDAVEMLCVGRSVRQRLGIYEKDY